ncbi:MAG: hypothetical protein L0Y50_03575 [Beijerinckiaceae bacterium]|nr:hypothetical protein [Beijerinckiaceae bacterium]MCI0735345.1 hypothetical protein [Beijerinckiaceae bacterium]
MNAPLAASDLVIAATPRGSGVTPQRIVVTLAAALDSPSAAKNARPP